MVGATAARAFSFEEAQPLNVLDNCGDCLLVSRPAFELAGQNKSLESQCGGTPPGPTNDSYSVFPSAWAANQWNNQRLVPVWFAADRIRGVGQVVGVEVAIGWPSLRATCSTS